MTKKDPELLTYVFPHLFTNGEGGPVVDPTLNGFYRHCLLWHDGRFARDAEFLFLAYKALTMKTVFGICATAMVNDNSDNTVIMENDIVTALNADQDPSVGIPAPENATRARAGNATRALAENATRPCRPPENGRPARHPDTAHAPHTNARSGLWSLIIYSISSKVRMKVVYYYVEGNK